MIDFLNPEETEKFVEVKLGTERDRLAHVLVVAEKVNETSLRILNLHPDIGVDPSLAVCAALLHDIGYASDINITGFHPVDGSNFLIGCGYPNLAELIIDHSCSPEEAAIKGLAEIIPSA